MARLKKYQTQQQRTAARKQSKKRTQSPSLRARYFRLVIPNLTQYKDQPQALIKLKGDTLQLLLQRQQQLQFYKIAIQTHATTLMPHLDILLLYKTSVLKSLRRYDYLVKTGHLSHYRKLNEFILVYGDKQDQQALTNFPSDLSLILQKKKLQQDPYTFMKTQMLKDPFHFNVHQWLSQTKLDYVISKTNWSKSISLLHHQQQVQCNKILQSKPGFQLITKQLIRKNLSREEYRQFTKSVGFFGKIVGKINEIVGFGYDRPFKTPHLLLVGRTNIGKTTLGRQIQKHVSVYHHGVHNWWPRYRSNVYKMIFWNQFNLRSMAYPQLLNFLEGMPMDLQYKGGSVLKTDNQLIFMTSNMSLEQHICTRFSSQSNRQHARANLRARIEQINIPEGLDLFFLTKLLVP